jgi:hypothetical protein
MRSSDSVNPKTLGGVVSFLLGPDGDWFNGQVIRVNDGDLTDSSSSQR